MQNTPSSPALPSLSFFGDASSKDRQFMVAGGFVVHAKRVAEVEAEIAKLRQLGNIQSEFHWSAYRGGDRRKAYEGLAEYAFRLVEEKKAALHVIVVDFSNYNHRAVKGEDRDTSINRMYYQLCLHRLARYYSKSTAIHVHLDAGNDSRHICEMRNQLCADAYRKYKALPNSFRAIQPLASHKSGIIQMADVIVGAIAAKRNNVQHASPKGALADYVLKMSGRDDWKTDTLASARFMTLWHFKGK